MVERFDSVARLISAEQPRSDGVMVAFRCPTTGVTAEGFGSYPATGWLRRTRRTVSSTALNAARMRVAAMVRRATGTSLAGSIAGNTATEVVYQAGQGSGRRKVSDKDRKLAVMDAFASVNDKFVWVDASNSYVGANAAEVEKSAAETHLTANPLTAAYDRQVFGRMIAAVIAADGSITDDEKTAFNEFVPGSDLQDVLSRPRPTQADFAETMQGPTRETMLLLAWSVALCDGDLDPAERSTLRGFAEGLGISEAREAELMKAAQSQVIEEGALAMASQGESVDEIRTQAEVAARQIGFEPEEAARIVIRWAKRTGRL